MTASLMNLRDLGGHVTQDGHAVRRGLVYRSDMPEDPAMVDGLGLKCVFDLRTPEEARAKPGHWPVGLEVVSLDVMADANAGGLAGLERLIENPAEANRVLGSGQADSYLERAYRGFVAWPSAQHAYRQLFLSLGQRERLPSLFHCATGKDRTGWAAAALLTLLGVPRAVVMADYLRSNDHILPRYAPMIDAFEAAGGDRAILVAVFGVKAEQLNTAFEEMETRFESVERYFADGLGIDASGQDALRETYLERQ